MKTCGGCPHPQTIHDHDGDCAVLHCGCHWTPPTAEYPILLPSDVKVTEQLVCGRCDRPLKPGDPYTEQLEGMNGDRPVVEITCVYC